MERVTLSKTDKCTESAQRRKYFTCTLNNSLLQKFLGNSPSPKLLSMKGPSSPVMKTAAGAQNMS